MEFVSLTPLAPIQTLFSLDGARRRNPLRKRVLRVLSITPATMTDLIAALEVPREKLEQQLRTLVAAGEILEDRAGPVPRFIRA